MLQGPNVGMMIDVMWRIVGLSFIMMPLEKDECFLLEPVLKAKRLQWNAPYGVSTSNESVLVLRYPHLQKVALLPY